MYSQIRGKGVQSTEIIVTHVCVCMQKQILYIYIMHDYMPLFIIYIPLFNNLCVQISTGDVISFDIIYTTLLRGTLVPSSYSAGPPPSCTYVYMYMLYAIYVYIYILHHMYAIVCSVYVCMYECVSNNNYCIHYIYIYISYKI